MDLLDRYAFHTRIFSITLANNWPDEQETKQLLLYKIRSLIQRTASEKHPRQDEDHFETILICFLVSSI